MAAFDFVTDEELRASLTSDEAEMAKCMEAGAHKAVVVLAGSLVEALLTDHLSSVGYADPKGKPLLEHDLGQLIAAARAEKAISGKAADLSSVVKTYRNLIHPGRAIRLKEKVDADTAAVAVHLVSIVKAEVAALKQKTYGYTAQQIVSKIEKDATSMPILGDLLARTNDDEQEQLLTSHLPTTYLEITGRYLNESDDYWYEILTRLETAYRTSFDQAPDPVKRRVATSYAASLREDTSEFSITTRERELFQATDLKHMTPEDADMAKRHLLSRIGRTLDPDYLRALTGIGAYANSAQLLELVDAVVRYAGGAPTRVKAEKFIRGLHQDAPDDLKPELRARLSAWQDLNSDKHPDRSTWLQTLVTDLELEDLPF